MTNKSLKITVIEPQKDLFNLNFKELWDFHNFLFVLVWRDLKIRYKQTVVGVAWVWFQPLMLMTIYSIFFGYLAKFPSGEFPYQLFVLSGIIPWLFVSRAISESSNSLIGSRDMLTRLYFPRLILPLSSILGSFIDMLVAVVLLIGAMIYYGQQPSINIIYLPLFLLMLTPLVVGLSVMTAGLNVIYRDFGFIVPLFLQVWMFSSPIIYSTELVPHGYRVFYGLNPLVGILEGIRWSLGGIQSPPIATDLLFSGVISLSVMVVALLYFRKVERTLVDKL